MRAPRTLVASVGYHLLSDLSFGPLMVTALRARRWPAHVEVDDLSYGPVAVVHRLQEADPLYDRLVVVAAIDRGLEGPKPRRYRWDHVLPDPEEIQARVSEAVTGVVDLDNLLIVTQQFGALPREVLVVEIQPVVMERGVTPSPPVLALFPMMEQWVVELATAPPGAFDSWDPRALGGVDEDVHVARSVS